MTRGKAVIVGIISVLVLLVILSLSENTIADDGDAFPTPPPDPWASSGGSSSGSGSSSTYTPPVFNPYTVNVTSTDNGDVGTMYVKDYSLATVQTSQVIPAGNGNASVGLTADLSFVPSAISLDITPVNAGAVDLPFDLGNFSSLLAFDMTRSTNNGGEWSMKAGTIHITFSLPLEILSGMDLNSTFYLLKDDGTRFIIYDVLPVIENGMVLFDVPLYYESSSPSNSGTFMLAGPKAVVSTTITPTPTPGPATPTPKATGSNASILMLVAALAIAAIFVGRCRKQ
jgi:hypothetical protein